MAKKHWSLADFVETHNAAAYDGSAALNRYGYCRKCFCDMQSFGGNGRDGALKHYHSHSNARSAGVYGTRLFEPKHDPRPKVSKKAADRYNQPTLFNL